MISRQRRDLFSFKDDHISSGWNLFKDGGSHISGFFFSFKADDIASGWNLSKGGGSHIKVVSF